MKWTKAKYLAYLKAPHWKKIQRTIYRKRRVCYIKFYCSKQLNIHHLTYKNIGNESETDLVVLCEDHHKDFHHWAKGSKRKPDFVALQEYWVRVRTAYHASKNTAIR